ncbi:hypothetical protein [Methylobacterium sp. P1-11]|uniref:hypothetical protein n=1 Tax=Methylobacterium sp. P1-11 TaxID=2024616 RepID=UPI0018D993D6|nr:hypothetical protein [Methylobacterium sp. P1-11]
MLGRVLRTLGRFLAIATVFLVWLPTFVFLAGLTITNLTGCHVTEAGAQPCLVAGADIGHDLYAMLMMGWIVIALLPLMFATVVAALVWGAIRFMRTRRRIMDAAIARDGSAQGLSEDRSRS